MKYVILRKMGGFYNVFDNNAIIVGYLCNYKIYDSKCSFPISALDKVINILENNKVSYIVIEKGSEKIKKDYKKNNKYDKVLNKGMKKYNIDYRINNIVNKLSSLSYDRLDKILGIIEDYIDE